MWGAWVSCPTSGISSCRRPSLQGCSPTLASLPAKVFLYSWSLNCNFRCFVATIMASSAFLIWAMLDLPCPRIRVWSNRCPSRTIGIHHWKPTFNWLWIFWHLWFCYRISCPSHKWWHFAFCAPTPDGSPGLISSGWLEFYFRLLKKQGNP